MQLALDEGWIRELPVNNNFVIFDIESTLPRVDCQMSRRQYVTHRHELLSIAVNSFINGQHTQRVWVISETSESARMEIVEKFVEFLVEAQESMVTDNRLETSYEMLKIEGKRLLFN